VLAVEQNRSLDPQALQTPLQSPELRPQQEVVVNLAESFMPSVQSLIAASLDQPLPQTIISTPFIEVALSDGLRRLAQALHSEPETVEPTIVQEIELAPEPGVLAEFSFTAERPEPTGLNLASVGTVQAEGLGVPMNFQFPRVDQEQALAA